MALVNNTATNANSAPITDWSSLFGAGAGALAAYLGNSTATNALTGGEQNAINTQSGVQGQLQSIYGTQIGTGNAASLALGQQLGLYGTPNYAAFNNSPGFQFAEQQGDQAIQRTAAANGSVYTPNELAMLGQYNTGYASQNYNNYISQLMSSAGLGAQANAGLASGYLQTGGNISQLQQNQGNAQASGALGNAGVASNLISRLPWSQIGSSLTGSNSSGVNNFLGGSTGSNGYSDYNPVTGSGNYSSNSLFDQYANNSGYDSSTGSYSGLNSPSFSQYALNNGYDSSTGDYSGGLDLSGGF